MDPQDSLPEQNEGVQQVPSPQESAEQQAQSQPSNEQVTPVENDTPSQAQDDNSNQNDGSDDELVEWAKSQGYSLETETERTLAKRFRDTQKALRERANNNQQFNDIQQQIADDNEDPLEAEVRQLKAQQARTAFWDSNPEDRHLEGKMIEEVQKMVTNGDKAGAAYYSTPQGWSHLLAIVKANNAGSIKDESYEAGRKTERENLAKAQQASAPNAAATSSAPTPQLTSDEAIAKMSQAEYNEWRKTNNPFRA